MSILDEILAYSLTDLTLYLVYLWNIMNAYKKMKIKAKIDKSIPDGSYE